MELKLLNIVVTDHSAKGVVDRLEREKVFHKYDEVKNLISFEFDPPLNEDDTLKREVYWKNVLAIMFQVKAILSRGVIALNCHFPDALNVEVQEREFNDFTDELLLIEPGCLSGWFVSSSADTGKPIIASYVKNLCLCCTEKNIWFQRNKDFFSAFFYRITQKDDKRAIYFPVEDILSLAFKLPTE